MSEETTTNTKDAPTKDAPTKDAPQTVSVAETAPEKAAPKTSKKPPRIVLYGVAGVVLVVGALWGLPRLAYGRSHATTDDAAINGDTYTISPKISGRVESVLVKDNIPVKKGQLLVTLDARDLKVQLEQGARGFEDRRSQRARSGRQYHHRAKNRPAQPRHRRRPPSMRRARRNPPPANKRGPDKPACPPHARRVDVQRAGVQSAQKQARAGAAQLPAARAAIKAAEAQAVAAQRQVGVGRAQITSADAGVKAALESVTDASNNVRASRAGISAAREGRDRSRAGVSMWRSRTWRARRRSSKPRAVRSKSPKPMSSRLRRAHLRPWSISTARAFFIKAMPSRTTRSKSPKKRSRFPLPQSKPPVSVRALPLPM